MKVGAAWFGLGALLVELTKENIEMLHLKPKADEKDCELEPVIEEPNVLWNRHIPAVYTKFFDAKHQQWKRKTMTVRLEGDADEMKANVDKMARVRQTFYEERHSEPPETDEDE